MDPEAFEGIRLKHRIKAAIERIQLQIQERDVLHKRPSLSEVVEELINCWHQQEQARQRGNASAFPIELLPTTHPERTTVAGVLALLRDNDVDPMRKDWLLRAIGFCIEDYLVPPPKRKRRA